MSYEYTLRGFIPVFVPPMELGRETAREVAEALSPMLGAPEEFAPLFIARTREVYGRANGINIAIQRQAGGFFLETSGNAPDDYIDAVREAAKRLGPVVAWAGRFDLVNEETGGPDNRDTIYFGPTPRSIAQRKFDDDRESILALLALNLPPDAADRLHRQITREFELAQSDDGENASLGPGQ